MAKGCEVSLTEGDPPIVRIMGIPVTCFTVPALNAHLVDLIRGGRKAIVANVNLHAMNLAHEQPWFHDFLCRADSVFCDGAGVMLAARICGHRDLRVRITYADWLPLLADLCQEQGFSLYLLGAKPGVAKRAARQLTVRCPRLRVAGARDGYFDKSPAGPDNARVVADINASGADILVVAFGMPLQEKWLADNWPSLTVRVALTGGGALDYASGTLRRPPRWMTTHGLEWLGRFIVEPGRLWKRYLFGNPLFMFRLARTILKENRANGPVK